MVHNALAHLTKTSVPPIIATFTPPFSSQLSRSAVMVMVGLYLPITMNTQK